MRFADRVTVGRSAELVRIDAALDDVVAGRGGVLRIEGGPGLGKSHLVGELDRRATARGCRVHIGHADQLMQVFPLCVAAYALGVSTWSDDPVRAQIARLLTGEAAGELPYADPVLAASERMVELVEKLCADQALVLVLEDLHWADEASVAFAERLGREVDQLPLLLVLTARPDRDEPGRARDPLGRAATVTLTLSALSADDVAAFAGAHLTGPPGPRLSALLDTASGSPFYLREILCTLGEDELTMLGDGSVELCVAELVPRTLAGAVGRHLGVLSPDCLQTMRLAAFLGNDFTRQDLRLVLARDTTDALAAASAAGVVELAADRVRFRHELLRQVLLTQTPAALHAGLHGHIARALADGSRADRAVAGHLTAAADPLPGWALGWLAERPESTLYAAPAAYARLLRRAVDAVPDADGRRRNLVRQLMLVSFWVGDDETVTGLGAEAIASADDPDLAARLRIQVLRSLSRLRRFDEAVRVVAPSVTDPAATPVWRARAAAWSANAQAFAGAPEAARSVGEQALTLATSIGDPLGVAYAHSALAVVDGGDRLIAHLDAGLAVLGDDPESLDQRLLMAGNRAARLGALGSPDAEAAFHEVLVAAERVGTYRTSTVHAHAADFLFGRGRWDDALMHIAQMDASALRHPAFGYLHGMRAVIAYRRGEPEEGNRHLRAAGVPDPDPEEPPAAAGPHLDEALALRAESAGDHRQALLFRARYLDLPAGVQRDGRCADALPLIRLARVLGADEVARAAGATVEAARPPSRDGQLCAVACRAMLDGDVAGLLAVAERFLAGGWPLLSAFAAEEAAVLLAAAGDVDAARRHYLRASEQYAQVGADWDLRRAAARFRPYGIRRGTRVSPRSVRHGWESLTDTELRISRLVAQGLSNPDIAREMMLSRNTVQTHVSNVLRKLGRRSRTELARDVALHEPGVAPPAGVGVRSAARARTAGT
ncbi:AAA family ATPase [Micromonospora sp. NPDC051141]|uniref:helix-turn-helix transcriptional regulator n=1 Tax=Micromonospora sp. NPDC051141 TaxID=3364284 RepID=UPI0037970B78